MKQRNVNVAILGFGTVGSGVAQVLEMNRDTIKKQSGQQIVLKYILDVRDFPDSPFADKIVHDFSVIENDPEVNIVAETIGGAKIAYEFSKRALKAGKSVVTSNKELVATHGFELISLAKENNVNYLFEASVGGGIPVIRPIMQCLAANKITEVYGILNGTTNFILTKMLREGIPFADALKEAQQLGYAEADPTADIEGHDACRKICILGTLAFGNHIYPDGIHCEGISKITLEDMNLAGGFGYKIKLVGRTMLTADDKHVAFVAPFLVPMLNPLSVVDDVFNAIAIRGNAVGEVMFYGPGAGSLPTASAVVADVIDCAMHLSESKFVNWNDSAPQLLSDSSNLPFKWFVRFKVGMVPAAFSGVSPMTFPETDSVAYITDAMTKTQLDAAVQGAALSAIRVFE